MKWGAQYAKIPSKKGADTMCEKKRKTPLQIILVILYFIMFVPHIFMWACGIIDYINGADIGWFSSNYVYGIPAMADTMTWIFLVFIYIPIFEAAALYQGIYLAFIMNKYRETDKIRRLKMIWHIIGIAAITVFCTIYILFYGFDNLEDIAVIPIFLLLPIAVTYIVWGIAIFVFNSVRLKTIFRSYSKKVFHIVGISEILLFGLLILLTIFWYDAFGLFIIIDFFLIIFYIITSIVLIVMKKKK